MSEPQVQSWPSITLGGNGVRRRIGALLLLCLVIVACSSGGSDDLDGLTELGYTEETATCISEVLTDLGLDVETELARPEALEDSPSLREAVGLCIRDEDIPGIFGVDSIGEIEQIFNTTDTGDNQCLLDNAQAAGLGWVDLMGLRVHPDFTPRMTEIREICSTDA